MIEDESSAIMSEDGFTPDFEILDRYQAFSGELTRIALIGIGAVAAFGGWASSKENTVPVQLTTSVVQSLLGIAIFSFAVTAAAALAHRYWSTDAMAAHIALMRASHQSKADMERWLRNLGFARSGRALAIASISTVIAAIAFGAAVLIALP